MSSQPSLIGEPVIDRAKSWGFSCQLTSSGDWQIFPQRTTENWKLSQLDSRWILSLDNMPQIYLSSWEVITFLKRRQRLLEVNATDD